MSEDETKTDKPEVDPTRYGVPEEEIAARIKAIWSEFLYGPTDDDDWPKKKPTIH